MVKKGLSLALILAAGFLAGCQTNNTSLYHWGAYEKLVYDMYVEPGQVPAAEQISMLEADIQAAEANGAKVHPGLYAHLAMMYAAEGKSAMAEQALNMEKQLFPESSTLIDTLLANAKGGQ